jgi:hypothetical protein
MPTGEKNNNEFWKEIDLQTIKPQLQTATTRLARHEECSSLAAVNLYTPF